MTATKSPTVSSPSTTSPASASTFANQPLLEKEKDFGMEHFIHYRLESVSTSKFKINFFNSFTNLKIILITSLNAKNVKQKLMQVYELYSRFLRNNAFYSVESLDGPAN